MVEIVSLLSLLGALVAVLTYFYLQSKTDRTYTRQIQDLLADLPTKMQQFYTKLESEQEINRQKLNERSFKDYLQHIKELEHLVFQPLTEKEIKRVINRGPVFTEENQIDKLRDDGIDLTNHDLSGIPFGNANVKFESDFPTEIE